MYAILNLEETGYNRSELDNCKRGCSEKTRKDPPSISVDNRMHTQFLIQERQELSEDRLQCQYMNESFQTNNENDLDLIS